MAKNILKMEKEGSGFLLRKEVFEVHFQNLDKI